MSWLPPMTGGSFTWPSVKPVSLSVRWLLLVGLISLMSGTGMANDRRSVSSLFRQRGFDADEYEVISQNYVIKVYRLINPLADKYKLNKIPVLLSHGIIWDSVNMMASSRYARPRKPKLDERVLLYNMENGTDDRGLHFLLSNNNYDVWMFDARGTTKENHGRISDGGNQKSFWDFSLDEQALFDLPSVIDFVMYNTGAKKISYIGFSQSTTFMFMLLSMRPEYHEKLTCFIALAPVAYTSHIEGLIWGFSLARTFMFNSVPGPTYPMAISMPSNFILSNLCTINFIRDNFCRMIYRFFSGVEDKGSNIQGSLIDSALKTTSLKAIQQFLQNAASRDFRMYDYHDDLLNLEHYGQTVPPMYNMSAIRLKTMVFFRGTNDMLSDPKDQMILLNRLKVPLLEDHILEDYSHIDFVISPTVVSDVNEPVLRVLDKLSGRKVKKETHTLGTLPQEMMQDMTTSAPEAGLGGAQVQVNHGSGKQVQRDDLRASGSSAEAPTATASSGSSSATNSTSTSSSSSLSKAAASSNSSSRATTTTAATTKTTSS